MTCTVRPLRAALIAPVLFLGLLGSEAGEAATALHCRAPLEPWTQVDLYLGRGLGGGIVECATERALWLPYVEVADIGGATDAARASGATVLLEAREGPTGWRSVVATPAAGEGALWQPKR